MQCFANFFQEITVDTFTESELKGAMKTEIETLGKHLSSDIIWPFLDPKDLRNWLCHSIMDIFKTENHCLALNNFKIQQQLYSMVKYS